jgi:hypothetical protein
MEILSAQLVAAGRGAEDSLSALGPGYARLGVVPVPGLTGQRQLLAADTAVVLLAKRETPQFHSLPHPS